MNPFGSDKTVVKELFDSKLDKDLLDVLAVFVAEVVVLVSEVVVSVVEVVVSVVEVVVSVVEVVTTVIEVAVSVVEVVVSVFEVVLVVIFEIVGELAVTVNEQTMFLGQAEKRNLQHTMTMVFHIGSKRIASDLHIGREKRQCCHFSTVREKPLKIFSE